MDKLKIQKFVCSMQSYFTTQAANKQGTGQTGLKHKLDNVFVVCLQQKKIFLLCGSFTNITPGRWQSKNANTIEESIETVFLIAICLHTGYK